MQLLENTFTGTAVLVGSSNEQRPQLHSPAFPVIFSDGKILDGCPNTAGIYYWQNNVNGKGYVGQTLDLRSRAGNYVIKRFKAQRLFYRAVQKYGIANFTCYRVMDCCPSKVALNYWETYWVRELDTFGPNGYNLTSGGCCAFSISKETRDKQRNAHFRDGYSGHHFHKGHKPTAATRKKLSDSHKRRCENTEVRRQLKEIASNTTEDTRTRIAVSVSCLWKNKEYRDRQIAARIGKTQSEETCYKHRKANLLRHGTLWKEFFVFD